jgi:cytoskeletal protein RodZ
MEKSIGNILKDARIAKNLSLEQASKNTKIHPNILKKIEADDFGSLGAVYARSFLKIYAEYLGLNKEVVIRGFEDLFGPAQGRQAQLLAVKKFRTSGEDAASSVAGSSIALLDRLAGILRKIDFRLVVILLIAVFLLGGLISMMGPVVKRSEAVKQARKKQQAVAKQNVAKTIPQQAPVAVKPSVSVTPKTGTVSSVSQTPSSKSQEKIVLTVKAKKKNWSQVKMDGKIVFQGVLAKGSAETWSANERFELWLGDAGAVQLEFNGKIFDKIGRPGQILKHVVLTRSGLSIKR